jgi:murein DD-endopeptidase MepM/ murein hydrolase activator NlpD
MLFTLRKKMHSSKAFFSGLICCAIIFLYTQASSLANNWAAFAVEAGTTKNIENNHRMTNNHSSYRLQDESGHPVHPISVVKIKNDLYFLGPECLWWCLGAKTQVSGEDILILREIEAPRSGKLKVSWQEANDFVYLPQHEAIVVIDKSGDMFEYLLADAANKHWKIRRANSSKLGPPDPDYMAACEMNDGILLLDPERNQIWFQIDKTPNLLGLLPGVLSWKLKAGDVNITDAISIAYYNGHIYVLKKHGALSKYGIKYGAEHNGAFPQGQLSFSRPNRFRPSRLYINEDAIYIVERENNRVLRISLSHNATDAFIFSSNSDLRGLVRAGEGFWIINGDRLLYKAINGAENYLAKVNPNILDSRLNGLILPIASQSLPSHPGVYPGARRLYRYGVHHGLDMFNQAGSKLPIVIGTPVRAVRDGQVSRVDLNYKDMNYATYNKVIRECFEAHQTSSKNADLLRGCQVWLDNGNSLITKYAHLDSANSKLRVGHAVKQGDIIGYVGVSGTGENLPGHARYPHVHFEIWLDGKYLGYGLTPPETMSLFEDIFLSKKK